MSLWLTHPLFIPSLVVGITILLWATSLLPEFITALLFFAVAMVAKIAPADVIFGGFASSAFWLVFSGFVLGIAIRKTGLADRAARALSSRLTDSWPLMVASVVLLSYALAFVMPSNMGRIALLMPIVAAMAKRAGINEGTRAWYGLALAVGFGTFQLSATILPANVPNLVMSGAVEGSYGIHLNYLPYLLLHTPVLGWLKGAVLIMLICWLFPGKPYAPRDLTTAGPMSRNEKRLAWMLAVVLLLWVSESWHGIGPAWTGLAAAVITLLPRVGFINGDEFSSGVNIRTCIYVAGILGVGNYRHPDRYWQCSGRGAVTGDAAGCGKTIYQLSRADRHYHRTQFYYDGERRSGAVYHSGTKFCRCDWVPATVGDYDSGFGVFHTAPAVSGVANCGGDGAWESTCEGGDAAVYRAGDGNVSASSAAGLSVV